MFKRLFKKLKKFFKGLFADGGTLDKVGDFLTEKTEQLDQVLKATNNILLIADDKLDKIEEAGFDVPDKIQNAIKKAVEEIGYWDSSINADDGFKSVLIAIARKIKGTKAHKEGIVQNIARYTLIKAFPKWNLSKKEASDIASLGLTIFSKKNR